MDQQLFLEALENLKIFAKTNDNKVSKKDVMDCIGHDIEPDETQWQMIAGYLRANGIELTDVCLTDSRFEEMLKNSVRDQTPEAEEDGFDGDMNTDGKAAVSRPSTGNESEDRLLSMYMDDLKAITPLSRMTQAVILQDVCEKDEDARNVIIGNYFLKIIDWVSPYKGKGIALTDMIQEGNVIIVDEMSGRRWMKELDAFEVMDSDNIDDWVDLSERLDVYLMECVKAGLDMIIKAQSDEDTAGSRVLSRVNRVNDAANRAFEEYGRKITIQELAEFMNVPVEDVAEALRLSANKIENVIVPG